MKNLTTQFKFLLLLVVVSLCSTTSWAQLSCYNIVGYLPSWQGDPAAIDYSKFTHLNYAFGIPNGDGTIGAIDNSAKLSDLVTRSHANNVKVLLSIGGWLTSSPSNTPFESIANSSTSINQFVNSCANLVTQYNLDGIDIDWEYPTSQAKWNSLMPTLATRIHGMGKLLTAAVPEGAYSGDNVGDISILDLVNIMAYDCACPTTSPYSEAVSALNYWSGRGVTQSKRILGVPFYSEDNYTSLHVQKANLVKTNGGGIMIWEISSPGDLGAIYSTLGTICKGITPTCPTVSLPGTIQAEAYCTMSGIQTEATTDTGGGQDVGYIDAGDWMSYKVTVPTTGTYTVQYRVASLNGGGNIHLEKLGGSITYGTIAVPNTGGWQNWQTISHTVSLTAGTQDIAIAAAAGGFNVNWLSIASGTATNIALGKTVVVSSTETASYPANYAVDGNASTRWSSLFSDPQWIYVDLGATYNVNRVKITWEAAYGKNYTIESSPNASTWTNLKTITNNTTLVNDHTGLSRSARYFRIYGTARGTAYGYSIFELEVYGTYVSARESTEETENIIAEENLSVVCYPNPVKGISTIKLNTAQAGHAAIDLFDALGNKMFAIFNDHVEAGSHEINFNTETMSPGLYIYKTVFNGKSITKKIIKQ